MVDWLKLYHNMPPYLRNLTASERGFYLRGWRCGPDTDRMVQQSLAREHWTTDQWRDWQAEKLSYLLDRAATRVPNYRDMWAQRRRRGDNASWQYLENWPILEKEQLRRDPTVFVADDCDPRCMFHEHTSGTSGKPLDLWWSRGTVRCWYALFEARTRSWYGVSRHDRWAILGGQLVVPVARRQPPFWVWNRALNQLYMSAYHLSPGLIPPYLDALQGYNIKYLFGYTSSLYALALTALDLRRTDLEFQVAITNAEPLYEYQREVIEAAFQCPVRETYGMAEIVAAAGECQAGQLHLWPEVGLIEVMQEGDHVELGEAGDLICTGLLNDDMPLIRYRVGDRGELSPNISTCSCGRSLPVLSAVEGRSDDLLVTADGRRIGRLDPVFKAGLPIREAQIIQESLNQVRVRYVPAAGFSPEVARSIIRGVQDRLGSIDVILEPCQDIPRDPNGKFRAVICNLSEDERASIR